MLWALPIVQGHNSKMGMWVPMRSQHAGTPQRQGAAWKHMGFRSQHAAALTAAEPSAGIQKVWRKDQRVLCKQKIQSSACSSTLNTNTYPRSTAPFCSQAGWHEVTLSLTTVAVSVPQLHLDEILHPKWVTDTALGE